MDYAKDFEENEVYLVALDGVDFGFCNYETVFKTAVVKEIFGEKNFCIIEDVRTKEKPHRLIAQYIGSYYVAVSRVLMRVQNFKGEDYEDR